MGPTGVSLAYDPVGPTIVSLAYGPVGPTIVSLAYSQVGPMLPPLATTKNGVNSESSCMRSCCMGIGLQQVYCKGVLATT